MSVRVLYFARSRELLGQGQEHVLLSDVAAHASSAGTSVSTASVSVRLVLAYLVALHPPLESLVACSLLALNHDFVACDSEHIVKDGDEVAFIQPISGG